MKKKNQEKIGDWFERKGLVAPVVHDALWASKINEEECGNLLYEANKHLEEMVELLENDQAVVLLGLYLSAKRHIKHDRDCKPCAETRLRYANLRKAP